jgi:hypothetical protein
LTQLTGWHRIYKQQIGVSKGHIRWIGVNSVPVEVAVEPEAVVSDSHIQGILLEEFQGVVDSIEGENAYVTLTSTAGEELIGEYSAKELAKLGIHERRRFRCATVSLNGKVEVQLTAVPDCEVSADEEAVIDRRLEDLVAGNELNGDY